MPVPNDGFPPIPGSSLLNRLGDPLTARDIISAVPGLRTIGWKIKNAFNQPPRYRIGQGITPSDGRITHQWYEGTKDRSGVPLIKNNFNGYTNPIYLVNLDTLEKIQLQFVPLEVSVDPERNFAALKSMGRNHPIYHYTGGEERLSMTIDWVANEEDKEDVIKSCRWVSDLSRNDGDSGKPPRVKLLWGTKIWADAEWLVEGAPYRMKLPDRAANMMFTSAIQSVTLVRIARGNYPRQSYAEIDIRF